MGIFVIIIFAIFIFWIMMQQRKEAISAKKWQQKKDAEEWAKKEMEKQELEWKAKYDPNSEVYKYCEDNMRKFEKTQTSNIAFRNLYKSIYIDYYIKEKEEQEQKLKEKQKLEKQHAKYLDENGKYAEARFRHYIEDMNNFDKVKQKEWWASLTTEERINHKFPKKTFNDDLPF